MGYERVGGDGGRVKGRERERKSGGEGVMNRTSKKQESNLVDDETIAITRNA